MWIIKYKYIFLSLSAILILGSLFLIFTKGIKKGIDFTGGTIINVTYNDNFDLNQPKKMFELNYLKNFIEQNNFPIKNISVIDTATSGMKTVRIELNGVLEENRRLDFEKAWSVNHDTYYSAKQISENTIGPSIGEELTQKAIWSVILVSILIILFITFAFRAVSQPVQSWKYGLITIVTLIHDVVVPTGVYAFLGEKYNYEIDSLFVIALLTILGISISDTIVVFDRIRENLKKKSHAEKFSETVGKSLNQTFVRSINTSLAVIIVLLALFYFGPLATRGMSIILITGMLVGTYSSIFVASPLLVLVEKFGQKKR